MRFPSVACFFKKLFCWDLIDNSIRNLDSCTLRIRSGDRKSSANRRSNLRNLQGTTAATSSTVPFALKY